MALLAALTAVSPAAGQRPKAASPEDVARAVVRADSAGDWNTLLRLAHPGALLRFRALQTFQLRMLQRSEQPWADSDTAVDSAQQARWDLGRERQKSWLLDTIFQVPSGDSLARTSPDTLLARWFRATRRSDPSDSTPGPPDRQQPATRVIGAVQASDTLAYVVIERAVVQPLGPVPELFRDFPREPHHAEVMVMRRYAGEWRSLLDGVASEAYEFTTDLAHDE